MAANRRNQNLCNGPVMDEGRERIRAALLRFGFDAQAEEIAMRALGEDPAHFQELLEVLWEEWKPAGGLQEGVMIRLARAMWLTHRADRMQEGYAVRQDQDVNVGREDRLHVQMVRLRMTANSLRTLAQSVAREDYITPREDLEMMKNLQQQGVVARRSARPPGMSPGKVPRPTSAPRKSRPPILTRGSCGECRIPTFGKSGGLPICC